MNIEEIKTLYRIMADGRMIVVRASVWNLENECEISQVEILKIQHFLGSDCALSHFHFDVGIESRRNTIRIARSFKVGPQWIQTASIDDDMVNDLHSILAGLLRTEDLVLGRNEEKKPNPWMASQKPFVGTVFHSPDFQRSVPASHPEMLPLLAMCFSSMSEYFVGASQHVPESEMLASFGSFVAQARRESTRILYGTSS